MKRITATAIGIVLAAGLAFAAPTDTPEELVDRVLAASTGQEMAATWKSWHPEAEHTVRVRIGPGQPDWDFSYRLSDWKNLPNWMDDPQVKEAMQGYKETARSAPETKVSIEEDKTIVTATTHVDYEWGASKDRMTQTDRFEIVKVLGHPVIRSLSTVFDYQ